MRNLLLLIMLGISPLLTHPLLAQDLQFKEQTGEVQLWHHNRHVYSYQTATKSKDGHFPRSNYVHPLYDYQGYSLTEDFPEDHLHHRGIFWAWHQLFLDGVSVADPWECKGIEWKVQTVDAVIDDGQAQLEASISWLIGNEQQLVLEEQLTITYQDQEGHYLLDFNIDFTPLRELALGGSADEKGYGGFSTRWQLGEEVQFFGASGAVSPRNTQVQAGSWIKFSGLGLNSTDLVLMYHPKSTASLQGWILRPQGSMQNPVWPGSSRINLSPSQGFNIRTRLVVFEDQSPALEEIEQMFQQYAVN